MAVALQLHRRRNVLAPVRQPPRWETSLPFTVKVVSNEDQLVKVQALRAMAYATTCRASARPSAGPKAWTAIPTSRCCSCRTRPPGPASGSARIQINWNGPLQIERAIQLPEPWAGKLLAEITRLAVLPGYNDQPVRLALVKASHLFCVAMQVEGLRRRAQIADPPVPQSRLSRPLRGRAHGPAAACRRPGASHPVRRQDRLRGTPAQHRRPDTIRLQRTPS